MASYLNDVGLYRILQITALTDPQTFACLACTCSHLNELSKTMSLNPTPSIAEKFKQYDSLKWRENGLLHSHRSVRSINCLLHRLRHRIDFLQIPGTTECTLDRRTDHSWEYCYTASTTQALDVTRYLTFTTSIKGTFGVSEFLETEIVLRAPKHHQVQLHIKRSMNGGLEEINIYIESEKQENFNNALVADSAMVLAGVCGVVQLRFPEIYATYRLPYDEARDVVPLSTVNDILMHRMSVRYKYYLYAMM